MLSERCRIEDNTVLPPDTMVPPYAIFAGSPGRQIGTMPEIADRIQASKATSVLRRFVGNGVAGDVMRGAHWMLLLLLLFVLPLAHSRWCSLFFFLWDDSEYYDNFVQGD